MSYTCSNRKYKTQHSSYESYIHYYYTKQVFFIIIVLFKEEIWFEHKSVEYNQLFNISIDRILDWPPIGIYFEQWKISARNVTGRVSSTDIQPATAPTPCIFLKAGWCQIGKSMRNSGCSVPPNPGGLEQWGKTPCLLLSPVCPSVRRSEASSSCSFPPLCLQEGQDQVALPSSTTTPHPLQTRVTLFSGKHRKFSLMLDSSQDQEEVIHSWSPLLLQTRVTLVLEGIGNISLPLNSF